MTKQTFKEAITLIESTYNDSYKPEIAKFMWKRFKNLSDSEFNGMVSGIMDTFKAVTKVPLPLIPHFLEVSGMTDEGKAVQAIEKVKYSAMKQGQYRSVNFGDEALHRTIENYGGWPVVAMWGEKDWNYNDKKFRETYKTLLKTAEYTGSHLVGLCEEDNLNNGYEVDGPVKIKLPWSEFTQIEYKKETKLQIDLNDVVKDVDLDNLTKEVE